MRTFISPAQRTAPVRRGALSEAVAVVGQPLAEGRAVGQHMQLHRQLIGVQERQRLKHGFGSLPIGARLPTSHMHDRRSHLGLLRLRFPQAPASPPGDPRGYSGLRSATSVSAGGTTMVEVDSKSTNAVLARKVARNQRISRHYPKLRILAREHKRTVTCGAQSARRAKVQRKMPETKVGRPDMTPELSISGALHLEIGAKNLRRSSPESSSPRNQNRNAQIVTCSKDQGETHPLEQR
eukprot:scaffold213_cov245-Pinguiococcus_pyrenoidosus.AAC.52